MTRIALFVALLLTAFVAAPAALAGPRKPKVVIIDSFSTPSDRTDVQNKLLASGLFETVDTYDAGDSTPTIETLRGYDAALVANGTLWRNRNTLGDVMKQYVDEGFGVVQTLYTVAGTPGANLGGGWTSDYNCIAFSSTGNGSNGLGTIALPDHPIVNGVATFNGGIASDRPASSSITAGATLVASWTDGKPLVVVGPKINRADLGFFPASVGSRSTLWTANSDGAKLLANALVYVCRPKILLVHSLPSAGADDVVSKLRSTELVGAIDTFDAGSTGLDAPTLDQLQQYDAVMVTNSGAWKNRTALGNVIADYTDWGGGVVLTGNTTSGFRDSNLGGRFTGDYRIIEFGLATTGTATLGTIAYSEHPILNGVSSFNGGSLSSRPSGSALAPGGLVVASWSDGKILAAVSTRRHNRADLGMFPVSSTAQSGGWLAFTDGAELMANALIYTVRPYVGIAHSQIDAVATNTRTRLLESRRFSGVSILPKLSVATPSVASLLPFGTVFSFSNASFLNADAVGENFADYVDAGGSVVQAVFSVTAPLGSLNTRPRGRWITEGYDITPEGSTSASIFSAATLGPVVGPAHPVHTFVRKFDGGTNAFRQGDDPILRGRRLLEWSDGRMLASVHSFRRRVDLGFSPVSSVENSSQWKVRTDGTTMIANALEFAAFMKPCPGDLNGDSLVDDSDFQLFTGFYDTLLDARGDLTGDNNTEDADFSVFAQSYDALLCP